MLLRWRELLYSRNSNFRFIRFDAAIESYGRKIGKNFQQVRMNQPVSRKYELWGCCLDAVAIMNFTLGNIQSAVLIDVAKGLGHTFFTIKSRYDEHKINKMYSEHLEAIEKKEAVELYEKLHEYFICDMCENMSDEFVLEKPIVIF